MPTYTFFNNDTNQYEDHTMSFKDLDQFKADNPQLGQCLTTPLIVSGLDYKPDDGFRDILKHVKKSHHGSNINTF